MKLRPPDSNDTWPTHDMSRDDFLSGRVRTFFGPGQRLDALSYLPPTDWLPDGSPITMPNVVFFTVVYPPWFYNGADLRMYSHYWTDRPPFYNGPGTGLDGAWATLDPFQGGYDFINFTFHDKQDSIWYDGGLTYFGPRGWLDLGWRAEYSIVRYLDQVWNAIDQVKAYFLNKKVNLFIHETEFFTKRPRTVPRFLGSDFKGLVGENVICSHYNGEQQPSVLFLDTKGEQVMRERAFAFDNTYSDSTISQPWALSPPTRDFIGCNFLHFYIGPYVELQALQGMDAYFYDVQVDEDRTAVAGHFNLKTTGPAVLDFANRPKYIQGRDLLLNTVDRFPLYRTVMYGIDPLMTIRGGSPQVQNMHDDQFWNIQAVPTIEACNRREQNPADNAILGTCDCDPENPLDLVFVFCNSSQQYPSAAFMDMIKSKTQDLANEMNEYIASFNKVTADGTVKLAQLLKAEGLDYEYRGSSFNAASAIQIIKDTFPEVA